MFHLLIHIPCLVLMLLFIPTASGGNSVQVRVPEELPACPLPFIRGCLVSSDGSIWIVGEKENMYRLEIKNGQYETFWTNINESTGFPQTEQFTCIAEDKQRRIWVGTDDNGVFVFNGSEWKTYNRSNTLTGEHVYHIAVSPVSGDVAVATSAGISIYNPNRDSWVQADRSNGLEEDQASAVQFDARGNLWITYAFGGISWSSAQTGYTNWKTLKAPWFWDRNQFVRQPYAMAGDGLPSNACNTAFCTAENQILVGTCAGLAFNNGLTAWRFMRGRDYANKNDHVYGSTVKKTAIPNGKDAKLLSEDFVSALAQQGQHLFVGYRTQGVDVVHARTMNVIKRIHEGLAQTHISSFLILPEGSVWAATYGKGLVKIQKGTRSYSLEHEKSDSAAKFPADTTAESSSALLQRLQGIGMTTDSSKTIIFKGEDWSTKGDWCGKYGLTYAVLCAANAPMDNSTFKAGNLPSRMVPDASNPKWTHVYCSYSIQGVMGLNRNKGDALRWWVQSAKVEGNRNVLFDPSDSVRTEAEWDDHGEAYAPFVDGPDIWVAVEVPDGVNEIALYFYNPNGYQTNESRRDYLIEARRHPTSASLQTWLNNDADNQIGNHTREGMKLVGLMEQWHSFPVEARTRVSRFAGSGVYKRFMTRKGGVYLFHICRNGSFNTILNGVFVNASIPLASRLPDQLPYHVAGLFAGIIPSPDKLHDSIPDKDGQVLLNKLYSLLHHPRYTVPAGSSILNRYLLALCREEDSHKRKNPLNDWLQWEARINTPDVLASFDKTMKAAWHQCQIYYPALRSRECVPHAAGTIPFSVSEVYLMDKLHIDWTQYRDDSATVPAKSVSEMKQYLAQKYQQTKKT